MIFLDSSDVSQVKRFYKLGIIRGVTTNPSILIANGTCGIKDKILEIVDIVGDYPVSVEVLSNDREEMMEQAVIMGEWAPSINIKIPIHGPEGEQYNLEIVRELSELGIPVNVTAMMSSHQCLLAILAGARYISLFGGRINNMAGTAIEEIKKVKVLTSRIEPKDSFYQEPEIIVGSVREVSNVIEWFIAGADIVTVPPNILELMIVHPGTKDVVKQFINDAKGLKWQA